MMAQYFVLKYLINFYSNPCWGSQTCDLQHCIVATQLLTCHILQQVMIQWGEQEDPLTKEMKTLPQKTSLHKYGPSKSRADERSHIQPTQESSPQEGYLKNQNKQQQRLPTLLGAGRGESRKSSKGHNLQHCAETPKAETVTCKTSKVSTCSPNTARLDTWVPGEDTERVHGNSAGPWAGDKTRDYTHMLIKNAVSPVVARPTSSKRLIHVPQSTCSSMIHLL